MFKKLRGSIMLLTAAILWGTTFVAQSESTKYVEPFTYNALRMLIGGIVLIPVILIFSRFGGEVSLSKAEKRDRIRNSVKGGMICGCILFIASTFQQIAIQYTTAGKSGFITALYIVIVPIIELIALKKNISKRIWLCVALAIAGFYLLCITDEFGISRGDLLTLVSAFFFACHIIVIDHFTGKSTNGILMACIQFFVSGFLALPAMALFESPDIIHIWEAKYTILYAGILSSGVAYTFQILGQQHTDPTIATLLMSLESVFAAISGWLVLGESFSLKEGIGCVLVFAAVIIAQL